MVVVGAAARPGLVVDWGEGLFDLGKEIRVRAAADRFDVGGEPGAVLGADKGGRDRLVRAA